MNKNICIIHFNTPVLTHCLIRSINKYTPGATIYVFDNSDKKPFINSFSNVTVFDNTKGEIVNFDEILSRFPLHSKSRGKTNNYGSAKHSISIQKCVELINENFVLLDSDVLLRRDITPVFDTKYVWVAGIEEWTNKTLVGARKRKRVCPFLMFMNVEKMKQLGITFYDDEHMLGFNNGPKCEEYETGVWFYEATPKEYRKIINYNDYIRHFRAGSWLEDARTKQRYNQIDPLKWLEKNQNLWLRGGERLTTGWSRTILQNNLQKVNEEKVEKPKFETFFDHIYCLHYLPSDDRLPKLREEFKRVGIDEGADYFSWVYDYPSPLNDLVFKDPKLRMDTALKASSREYVKRVSLKHYEIIKEAYSLGYKRILIMEDDVRFHRDMWHVRELLSNMPDTNVVMFDKMVCSAGGEGARYKQYINSLPAGALYGDMAASKVFFIFCSCYSLDRKAMERIIGAQEQRLLPPDTPLNDKELTGSFAIVNLAIQDPKLKTRKNEGYDKIGLDTHPYGRIEPEPKPYTTETPVTPGKPAPKITRVGEKKDDGPTEGEVAGIPQKSKIKESPGPVRRTVEKPVRFTSPERMKPMVTRRLEPQVKTVMRKEVPPVPVVTRRVATRERAREMSARNNTGKKVTGFNRLYDV